MLQFDYSFEQFKKKVAIESDKETLEDLYYHARDNMIVLSNVKKFVDGLKLVSHDEMLKSFNYRDLDDIMDTEAVIQIGDRWII